MLTTTQAPTTEKQLLAAVEAVVRRLLPPGWALDVVLESSAVEDCEVDACLRLETPDGESVAFVVEAQRGATAPLLRAAVAQLRRYIAAGGGGRSLVVAPWLGPSARQLLMELDVSYVDATGNVRLVSDRPGLFLSATGALKNPWPDDKALQSLRGKGAMRALRALLDYAPPYGVRDLASRTAASAATLSRVIALLDSEALVERDARGGVADLDWVGTIKRWARDYDVLRTNSAVSYLEPRGLPALLKRLRSADCRYAMTGSLGAREFAPVAPARLGMIYVADIAEAESELGLRRVDAGTNVMLLEPYDGVVFEQCAERGGLTVVSAAQLAVDLLTGPGRSPSEGEELLRWMKDNIDAWRS